MAVEFRKVFFFQDKALERKTREEERKKKAVTMETNLRIREFSRQ